MSTSYEMVKEMAAIVCRIEELEAENVKLREFVSRISKQKPEKPDYWCACGQCKRNIEDAEEPLEDCAARENGDEK